MKKTTSLIVSGILLFATTLSAHNKKAINSCSLTVTAIVINNVTCNGGSNGSAYAIASLGTPPYTYAWSPMGGNNDTAINLLAGIYLVAVTDSNGCTASVSVVITEPILLTAAITSTTNTTCRSDTGSASVTASGGTLPYTYNWSNKATTTAISGLSGGNYIVTVTDNNGCTATANALILGIGGFSDSISIFREPNGCGVNKNGFAKVIVTGAISPLTYFWSNGQTNDTISAFTSGGTYTVTIIDSMGCTVTDSVSFFFAPPLLISGVATTPPTSSCDGTATIAAFIGFPPYTYTWSNGMTTQTISGLCPGKYCCTVMDADSCTDTACGTVIFIPNCGGNPNICYVTSDTNSQHNVVVWQKTGIDTNVVDSFIIYRSVIYPNFYRLAAESVHALTEYTDTTSQINTKSYFYELGYADSCNTYPVSTYHESILLQASPGFGNKVNLNWNFYVGVPVNYYRILRDDSGKGNWHVIDSVSYLANAYTDTDPPLNAGLRYRISTNWNVVCSPFMIMPHHLHTLSSSTPGLSNISWIYPLGMDEHSQSSPGMEIFPNPANTALNIVLNDMEGNGIINITDVLGRNIFTEKITFTHHQKESINTTAFPDGVYFLTIENNQTKLVKKFIKLM